MEQAYLMEYTTEMFNCITTKDEDTSLSNDKLSEHVIWNGKLNISFMEMLLPARTKHWQ